MEVGNKWFYTDEYHVWSASSRLKSRFTEASITLELVSQADDVDSEGCVIARYFEFSEHIDKVIRRWGSNYIHATNSYESFPLETLYESESVWALLRETSDGVSVFLVEGEPIILDKLQDFSNRMRWIDQDSTTLEYQLRTGADAAGFTMEEDIGIIAGAGQVITANGFWSNGFTRLDSMSLGLNPTTKLAPCD